MLNRIYKRDKTQKIVSELLAKNKIVKLNLGCGTDYKKGWINVDNNSDDNIERLDLNWDITKTLPFADNSVDYIFHEHFMEHLTIEDSQRCIKDFMRVLKPGGIMRIAMPDLKDSINLYLNPNWRKDPLLKYGLAYVKTPAELLNICFRSWGHQWIYDIEELRRRLNDAGCTNIKQCKKGKSTNKHLIGLETREQSNLVVEVTR